MPRTKFSDLRSKMSIDAQRDMRARTEQMIAEMPRRVGADCVLADLGGAREARRLVLMPLRPCAPNCSNLVTHGRCEQCQKKHTKPSDLKRQTSHERGYDHKWRRARKAWLAKHGLCGDRMNGTSTDHSICASIGRFIPATVLDHISPHNGDKHLFWAQDNWQSLCEACHNRKTATEDGGFIKKIPGERFVVTGPPGCGKTTWVKDRAKPGDIVFDLDAVAVPVTNMP